MPRLTFVKCDRCGEHHRVRPTHASARAVMCGCGHGVRVDAGLNPTPRGQ